MITPEGRLVSAPLLRDTETAGKSSLKVTVGRLVSDSQGCARPPGRGRPLCTCNNRVSPAYGYSHSVGGSGFLWPVGVQNRGQGEDHPLRCLGTRCPAYGLPRGPRPSQGPRENQTPHTYLEAHRPFLAKPLGLPAT